MKNNENIIEKSNSNQFTYCLYGHNFVYHIYHVYNQNDNNHHHYCDGYDDDDDDHDELLTFFKIKKF